MAAPGRGDERPPRVRPVPSPTGLGRFGEFGGRFVPETLVPALEELEAEFRTAWASDEFRAEYAELLTSYAGRPTPVTECHRLSERLGVRVLLKREDLTHTGSHKINNVLGQALLTRRMGKQRVIAETGAGQHGVATATAAALFGLDCMVFMGAVDVERQALNVFRMKLLGAEVVPVTSGSATLKDAINDALRDWVATVRETHYCIGSVVGPHPFPWMVREFQRIVGDEAREQCREILGGADPDFVVACVGGGSNAIGTFAGFVDTDARLDRRRSRRARPRDRAPRRVGEPGRPRCRCTAPARCSSRTRTARSSRPTRSAPASTTRASGPSTRRSRPAAGPSTTRPPTRRRSRGSSSSPRPRASSPRSSRRTRSAGWPGRSAAGCPTGSTVLVTLSGRGDKDANQVAEMLTGEPLDVNLETHAAGPARRGPQAARART